MLVLVKTETVYFNSLGELHGYVDALASSENIPAAVALGIKNQNHATRATTVAQKPAMESYIVCDQPQIKPVGS